MDENKIHILVTFDDNYYGPFQTMFKSLILNNLGSDFKVWLAHGGLDKDFLEKIKAFITSYRQDFEDIEISRDYFESAKVTDRYPRPMYYRLMAPLVLPEDLERILYLDPDILHINPLGDLWQMDLGSKAFAAASHSVVAELSESVHKKRLDIGHEFFNTGVILMDLDKARDLVDLDDILDLASRLGPEHLYPDQDIFNILYGKDTLEIDDRIWNYDARFYPLYLVRSYNEHDLDWVMKNTSILHFCGKKKPWLKGSYNYFSALYRHFMNFELPDILIRKEYED